MNVSDIQLINDLRTRMQANVDAGRAKDHGITKEELQKVLLLVRGKRAATPPTATSTKKKKSTKVDPKHLLDDDLSFFTS